MRAISQSIGQRLELPDSGKANWYHGDRSISGRTLVGEEVVREMLDERLF